MKSHKNLLLFNDTFGESGSPSKLMDKYGLNSNAIVKAVEKVLSRK